MFNFLQGFSNINLFTYENCADLFIEYCNMVIRETLQSPLKFLYNNFPQNFLYNDHIMLFDVGTH